MGKLINDKSIFYSGLCYFLIMLCFILVRIIFGAGLLGDVSKSTTDYMFTFIVQIVLLVGLPLLIMRFCAKQPIKTIFNKHSFRPINTKMVLWSVLLGFCTYFLIMYVSSFWSGMLAVFGYSNGGGGASSSATGVPVLDLLLGFLFVGVLPGFCEEFSHRGMVLGNIKRDGAVRAILFSALLFGLMHLNIVQVGYAFVVGLILGTITLLTKSIFPAMIVHGVSNSINTYLSYASDYNWWGGDFYNNINSFLSGNNYIFTFIIGLLVLTMIVMAVGYIMLALFKQSKINEFFVFKKKLAKRLKNDDYSAQIDINDNKQVFLLYQETQLNNIQNKLANSNLSLQQLEQNIDKSTMLSIMFDEDVTKKQKPKHLDYIFYYCSMFLGAVVTIMTFIWGVL